MSIVDELHSQFTVLQEFLDKNDGALLVPSIQRTFPRTMLLAAASYFEHCLTHAVEQLAIDETADDHVLVWLIRNKVITRQYHTWFDWNVRNRKANAFFKMFGEEFQDQADAWIGEENLSESVAAFLEIGRERNRLVHENFGSAKLDKTAVEVHDLYKSAMVFVDWFPTAIRSYLHRSGRHS